MNKKLQIFRSSAEAACVSRKEAETHEAAKAKEGA